MRAFFFGAAGLALAIAVGCGSSGSGKNGSAGGGGPGGPGESDGSAPGVLGEGGLLLVDDGGLGSGQCNEEQQGCLCTTPGATVSCWTGLATNRNVGACHDGTQTCVDNGGEFNRWGPCVGEVRGGGAAGGAPAAPNPVTDSCAQMALTYPATQFPATVCVLTPAGSAKCSPVGTYGSPVGPADGGTFPPSFSGARCISGGEDFFCVVTSTNGVTCWGDGAGFDPAEDQFGAFSGTEETIEFGTMDAGITDISVGETHVCVLTTPGDVVCWGDGAGELNGGSTPMSAAPAKVAGIGGPAIAIASGDGFTCALRNDGKVLCWGNNTGGELGNAGTTASATPVVVTGLPKAATGIWADQATHPCAQLTDGTIWCWGTTSGYGTTGTAPAPVVGLGSSAKMVTTGGEYSMSCALMNNGGVQCWASYSESPLSSDGGVFTVIPADGGVVGLRSIDDDFCALYGDGGVSCWGSDPGIPNGTTGLPQPVVGL